MLYARNLTDFEQGVLTRKLNRRHFWTHLSVLFQSVVMYSSISYCGHVTVQFSNTDCDSHLQQDTGGTFDTPYLTAGCWPLDCHYRCNRPELARCTHWFCVECLLISSYSSYNCWYLRSDHVWLSWIQLCLARVCQDSATRLMLFCRYLVFFKATRLPSV